MAARELLREGHTVCVFEQGGTVGGVWQYTDDVEDEDLLGADPRRPKRVRERVIAGTAQCLGPTVPSQGA